ncbi:MAG: hypothetical protein ACNI25_10900 [Halarcobacter sp.]
MRKRARDSLIINNFFTLASIVIISCVLILYTNFISEKQTDSIKKLACEKQSYTYSKVFNEKLLKKSINAIEKGYYKLEGSYLKAVHMKSNIENIVSLDELDGFYIDSLGVKPKNDLEKFLKIKYEIIENDKKDPNKKNEECKLNAGSVMTSFKINSTEIFRVYTDFQFMYTNAIKDRIDCSIKVFKNYVKN